METESWLYSRRQHLPPGLGAEGQPVRGRTEQHDVRRTGAAGLASRSLRVEKARSFGERRILEILSDGRLPDQHRKRGHNPPIDHEPPGRTYEMHRAGRFDRLEGDEMVGGTGIGDRREQRPSEAEDRVDRAAALSHAMDLRPLHVVPLHDRDFRLHVTCEDGPCPPTPAKTTLVTPAVHLRAGELKTRSTVRVGTRPTACWHRFMHLQDARQKRDAPT